MKVVAIVLGALMTLALLVGLSIFGWFTGTYDILVQKDQKSKQCFAQIKITLQRQNDVTPPPVVSQEDSSGNTGKAIGFTCVTFLFLGGLAFLVQRRAAKKAAEEEMLAMLEMDEEMLAMLERDEERG